MKSSVQDVLKSIEGLTDEDQQSLLVTLESRFRLPTDHTGSGRIVKTPGICGGSARLVRTRIAIWALEEMRQVGVTEAEMLTDYPALTASDLAAAWDYIANHEDEIQRELAANRVGNEI